MEIAPGEKFVDVAFKVANDSAGDPSLADEHFKVQIDPVVNYLDGYVPSLTDESGVSRIFGGICGRNAAVRDAILDALTDETDDAQRDCGSVTSGELAELTSIRVEADGQAALDLQLGDFDGLSSLTELEIYDRASSGISPDAFSGLGSVSSLDITGGVGWTTVREDLFSHLPSLEQVTLRLPAVKTLPDGLLAGLPIDSLAVSSCLDAMPPDLFPGDFVFVSPEHWVCPHRRFAV